MLYIYVMTKAEHIVFWREEADFDWPPLQRMIAVGDYLNGLFYAHLMIEKLSKAHWIKDNEGNTPPRTHNIGKLWQATQLTPDAEQEGLATELNRYQLEGRYADYLRQLRTQTTAAYANQLLTEITALRTWLLSTLP